MKKPMNPEMAFLTTEKTDHTEAGEVGAGKGFRPHTPSNGPLAPLISVCSVFSVVVPPVYRLKPWLSSGLLAGWCVLGLAMLMMASIAQPVTTPAAVEVKSATVQGNIDGETARLVIQANLGGWPGSKEATLWSATFQHRVTVQRPYLKHFVVVKVEAIRGGLREVVLPVSGTGEIGSVSGEGLEDWSLRKDSTGSRFLILRVKAGEKPVTSITATVMGETRMEGLGSVVKAMTFGAEQAALGSGSLVLETPAEFAAELVDPEGLVPIEASLLPEGLRPTADAVGRSFKAYRFLGTAYSLPVRVTASDPEAGQVTLSDFLLEGDLLEESAAFVLTAIAKVREPRGGRLELLSGDVALSESAEHSGWRLVTEGGRFAAVFPKAGEYAIRLRFQAGVRVSNEWNRIAFRVAGGALSPVVLRGLAADTSLELAGAARPERVGEVFKSFLPASGQMEASWRQALPEAEGRLFYSAEAVTQVAVSPGLLRQTSLLELRVMQGEMTRVTVLLRGEGEVTRVQGPQVLSWAVEPGPVAGERRLQVQFNQPQRELASVQIQIQQALGAFPLSFEAVQPIPDGATRMGGYLRLVNEGAVRLEVLESAGLSQISPEQFIQSDAVKTWMPPQTTQVFAYRFSGATVRLRAQADNILPELSVSEILLYHLGESELTVDAELEVDVREAPLREMTIRVPRGYTLAKVEAPGLGDHFLTEPAGEPDALLRLVYGAPVLGRQVVQLRLERNQALGGTRWDLPKIEVLRARSVRGNLGVSADTGFRLTPATTSGLTEQATAFFPKRVVGLQAAFRLSEPTWQARLSVERMAQSIQADVFHLFSVGEGIAYGSSLINYVVSGAPVSVLEIELSGEYFNVEFTGKNVRNWQKTERGFRVQLHTPASGTYTLLATYERPFKAQGETLSFTGGRPMDAQTEQGYTLVISANQFQVVPVTVTGSLTPLETGEVPAEYRLFFDAPILAAYRYTARPFNLQLQLKPLAQAEVVSQVVDRAAINTRITEEGQVVTEGRYFVKNKGAPHLRVRLPKDSELWSVTVDGVAVVPVKDETGNLIPLPNRADPNVLTEVRVKVASRSRNANRLTVEAPVVASPVLLAEWHIEPATGRRLVYRGGTLTPAVGELDPSGFAGLARLLRSEDRDLLLARLAILATSIWLGGMIWSGRLGSGPRFGLRHLASGFLGFAAAAVALLMLVQLGEMAHGGELAVPADLRFVAPIQQGDVSWRVDLANVEQTPAGWLTFGGVVLVGAAVVAWMSAMVASRPASRAMILAFGWCLVLWAALRAPSGPRPFVLVMAAFAFLQVLLPAWFRWWRVSGRGDAVVPTAALIGLLGLGVALGATPRASAADAGGGAGGFGVAGSPAESVIQELTVADDFVTGRAMIRWQGAAGAVLPLLSEPGVLIRSGHPEGSARLVQVTREGRRVFWLLAETNVGFEFPIEFQARVIQRNGERGFVLPVFPGLVNRVRLTLPGLDVDVFSPQAVLVRRESDAVAVSNTVASLVLSPVRDAWIGWRPRTRDTRREKAVFYAELAQAFVPGPGVVEGVHEVQVRPAQGEVGELVFDVPTGMTIADVQSPSLTLWRFDPDTRALRASFSPAQSKPFTVVVRSQVAATPLPFERVMGLIEVRGAAGQIGLVGVATGSEVQLDEVLVEGVAAINLDDFPVTALAPMQQQVAGLALRRAYRYSAAGAKLTVKASAVEPDVRVESQQTISLSEDRVVLAATLDIDVTRAGIFKLSFPLPAGLDVESITGDAMSHWTELKADSARVITLHLKGKTEGRQRFNVTLTGQGVKSIKGWVVPRLALREAAKQRGQLFVVPEQGLRLQVTTREGVTQSDPQQLGVKQRGLLAFRILQEAWNVVLDLERVDAWIQVTSLQHVAFAEAQMKVSANLQYEIENTGVKALVVRLPAAADGVRFRGEHVGDFLVRPGSTHTASKDWEVKLERRLIGKYLLQVSYTLPIGEQAGEVTVDGVQAQEVNLQRGFVTVQAGGRLQVQIEPPSTLQPTDWQVIPRALQQDIAAPSANFTYRLVDPAFRLPVKLVRHEAARLLPARVNSVALTSVISDDGATLTQVKLRLIPGDKRLLHVSLPKDTRFWFAFVNQNSVWPWQATNQVLIPLEQNSRTGEESLVEFYYTGVAAQGRRRTLDLALPGPRIDLPLENITWTVYLNEKWRLDDWSGTLRLQESNVTVQPVVLDVDSYVRNEAQMQEDKTKEAEQVLSLANTLLLQGDPQQARRAFKAAYGLSQHDQAFNEDARVQLNNLKVQQAMVGINVRQARVAGGGSAHAATPSGLRDSPFANNYTQVEAKQILERNSAEENAFQTRLSERLIQQQDAAVSSPAAIRATLPEQGRKLVFTRPLEIDASSELKLRITATAAHAVSFWWKLALLLGAFVGALLLTATVRARQRAQGMG